MKKTRIGRISFLRIEGVHVLPYPPGVQFNPYWMHNRLETLQLCARACVCTSGCAVCICAVHLCKRQFLSPMNKSAPSAFSQMITKCILPLPDSSLIIKGRFGFVDRCREQPTTTRLGWTLGVCSSRHKRRLRAIAVQLANHSPNCL